MPATNPASPKLTPQEQKFFEIRSPCKETIGEIEATASGLMSALLDSLSDESNPMPEAAVKELLQHVRSNLQAVLDYTNFGAIDTSGIVKAISTIDQLRAGQLRGQSSGEGTEAKATKPEIKKEESASSSSAGHGIGATPQPADSSQAATSVSSGQSTGTSVSPAVPTPVSVELREANAPPAANAPPVEGDALLVTNPEDEAFDWLNNGVKSVRGTSSNGSQSI